MNPAEPNRKNRVSDPALLRRDIRTLKGIGEKKAQAMNRLGIFSFSDLLSFYPRRYEDRSVLKPIAGTAAGESVCIEAVVADEPRLNRIRRGLTLTRFRVYDDTGEAILTYFNQPYVKNQIRLGETYRFFGRMEVKGRHREMTNPVFEKEGRLSVTGKIIPVYPLVSGLQQRDVRQSVAQCLELCREQIPDVLPESVRTRYGLIGAAEACQAIHFPPDTEELEQARRRLVFEELFVLCCALGHRQEDAQVGVKLPIPDFTRFYNTLPYLPTAAQQRAVREAAADLASGLRMNRLLQGDVGSGKTLVSAALIWQCHEAGMLSAFMAPTEILAEQQYRALSSFLQPLGLRIELLTGSMPAKEKRRVADALQLGQLDLIVGTHALLSGNLYFPKLALTVTDEQHRFGVRQRSRLSEAGGAFPPHVFVMSATPIPRTLALILYGDLSVSVLDELPPGRQKVDTFRVNSSYRPRLLSFIRKLCREGRQVFVVCPKVEDDPEACPDDGFPADLPEIVISPESGLPENGENSGKLLSAVDYARWLQTELPELRVACVHGRMKAEEKDAIMTQMLSGSIDVLVATTVIEVGVDIPNAALMLIENADRFGLSQLHQLRGRVGRGSHKSYCVLISDSESEEACARLDIMKKTNDGFLIAEEDLRIRGPGDFFGTRQHGLPDMHITDLGAGTDSILKSKEAADDLLSRDPALSLPEHAALRERVLLLTEKLSGTLN